MEGRTPSLTTSVGFKQLCNNVFFVNLTVHGVITAASFPSNRGGDSLLSFHSDAPTDAVQIHGIGCSQNERETCMSLLPSSGILFIRDQARIDHISRLS